MEMESFEDSGVADVLNRHFVAVKVDREERPDVDSIYMSVCQMLTGSGGWPLSIFMDGERKPFYAGTYFPKKTRGRYIGFTELLERINDMWRGDRITLFESRDKIVSAISAQGKGGRKKRLAAGAAGDAYKQLAELFDGTYGGFGHAPKFPSPHQLIFLMRYGKENSLGMVEKTLTGMYEGGIYDHIGYGFSRYSTDEKWLVPHFEKMLYDNALLAMAYLECFQATGKAIYADAAREIFEYIVRDMTSEAGGFYSAEDADSEGVEGKFYVWEKREIYDVLGKDDARRFCEIYGITEKGNFEGKNIPNLIGRGKSDVDFCGMCREKLFAVRERREHPFKDDKILTSWNGLMIAAFAIGARLLDSVEYLSAAEGAAGFLLGTMYRDGALYSRYRHGDVRFLAYADDYAFLTWGLIELYEASFNTAYLKSAVELTDLFISECWDGENGGFFLSGESGERLITRSKEIYDGAAPSANSAAALNLLRLARLTGNFSYEDKAWEVLDAFGGHIERVPMSFCYSLAAFLGMTRGIWDIVVAAKDRASAKPMLDAISKKYPPDTAVLFYDGENGLEQISPFVREYKIPESGCTAYVCGNGACLPPVSEAGGLPELARPGR